MFKAHKDRNKIPERFNNNNKPILPELLLGMFKNYHKYANRIIKSDKWELLNEEKKKDFLKFKIKLITKGILKIKSN